MESDPISRADVDFSGGRMPLQRTLTKIRTFANKSMRKRLVAGVVQKCSTTLGHCCGDGDGDDGGSDRKSRNLVIQGYIYIYIYILYIYIYIYINISLYN